MKISIQYNVVAISGNQQQFTHFLAIISNFWQLPAIFGNFRFFVVTSGENQNKFKSISQSSTNLWPFPTISGNYRQILAIIGNFGELQVLCCNFWKKIKN